MLTHGSAWISVCAYHTASCAILLHPSLVFHFQQWGHTCLLFLPEESFGPREIGNWGLDVTESSGELPVKTSTQAHEYKCDKILNPTLLCLYSPALPCPFPATSHASANVRLEPSSFHQAKLHRSDDPG